MDSQDRLKNVRPVQVGTWIPYVLRDRLDALCELLAHEAPELGPVRFKELLAALILAAPEASKELAELVADYRGAPPEKAAIQATGGNIVPFERKAPGPRRLPIA